MANDEFQLPEDTSTDPPKYNNGFDSDGRITARKVSEETGRVLSWYETEIKKYAAKFDSLDKKIGNLDNDVKETRTDNTKSLAVFVAFFTFISLSFSILPQISHPLVLLGVVLVLLACLTFFVLLLTWATNDAKSVSVTPKQWGVLIVFLVLLVVGISISWFGYNEMKDDERENQSEFYTQEQIDQLLDQQLSTVRDELEEDDSISDFQKILTDFKRCIRNRGLSACLVE